LTLEGVYLLSQTLEFLPQTVEISGRLRPRGGDGKRQRDHGEHGKRMARCHIDTLDGD
jgi:hypothetical protein